MTIQNWLNSPTIHPSWHKSIEEALEKVAPEYIENLSQNNNWIPGHEKIFNAFSIPMDQVNYVLFGESPYPRVESANGLAFWDAAVKELWSPTGFSKQVNRATSLRNIIKMLLVAEGALAPYHVTQMDIAKLDKAAFVKTNNELFQNLINHGFLLLNASLVLQPTSVRKDAIAWHPFIKSLLDKLFTHNPQIQLILLGNIANTIDKLIEHPEIKRFYAEHPYNISFIHNQTVLDFFKPFQLLRKTHTNPEQLKSNQFAML